jgi:hypothetical protein
MLMSKETYKATMKEQNKQIKDKQNEMFIARQCCNYLGFYCHCKTCKNTCCPLNHVYAKSKFKKNG